MNLAIELLRRLDEPKLKQDEKTLLRCALAKALESAGNYEAAVAGLGELWQGVGRQPALAGLGDYAQAEVLLRVGALTGWLGSVRQIAGAQEAAKDLISASMARFTSLAARTKAAEAQIELAWCYWRAGAYDEARVLLRAMLDCADALDDELRTVALLRCAEVERADGRLSDARVVLAQAEPFVKACSNDALTGIFHGTLASTFIALSAAERRPDYIDQALIELAAASYHLEQAGHTRFCARAENNLGCLFARLARFTEAHEHFTRARRLFVSLNEVGSVAQVDDSRARAFVAEGRYVDAEKTARCAVRALAAGDELALLTEALTTHGTTLARLERTAEARGTLERALETGDRAGVREGVGLAALVMLEELGASLEPSERHALYLRADDCLASTQDVELHVRLRICARQLLDAQPTLSETTASVQPFIYAAETSAQLLHEARCVAQTDGLVLLSGETGTGKEVLARLIHEWSGRRGPFVAINCAALCATLVESQLFGHRKGSFTGAIEDYAGAARAAEGGTLFLDEIGELSLANQAKLLRLIEQGEVYALGSALPERINVRIIAATNHELRRQVERKQFRADLFYRLTGFHLEILPLRKRVEDIIALAHHFIETATKAHQKRIVFTPESFAAMQRLPLAGNVRELRALVERTFITAADGAVITAAAVETVAFRGTHGAGFAEPWSGCSLEDEMRAFEARLIKLALDQAKGSVTQAARLLNVTHQGLAYILKGRQRELLAERKPTRTRRVSLMRGPRPAIRSEH
jgi:DNA-binding NtrC family response regulator